MSDLRNELEDCKKQIKKMEFKILDLLMEVEGLEDILYQQEYCLFRKVVCFPVMNEN